MSISTKPYLQRVTLRPHENAALDAHPFDIAAVAYEDTEHYAVTRDFLTNYPRRLEQLFADDDGPATD